MRTHIATGNRNSWTLPFLVAGLLLTASQLPAQVRPVEVPTGGKITNSAYSAAIDAGDYVYISGQGGQRTDGSLPTKFDEQASQALDDIKTIVEAAGLSMKHVVYVQVYLEDVSNYEVLNKAFAKYFPTTPPARAVLGVARVSQSPLVINAVAVRDLKGRAVVIPPNYKSSEPFSPGILTHD